MRRIDTFIDSTGTTHDVAADKLPEFQQDMQAGGMQVEPVFNFSLGGEVVPVRQSKLPEFQADMQAQNTPWEPVSKVITDDGTVHEVAKSRADDFLRDYRTDPAYAPDREAVRQKAAEQARAASYIGQQQALAGIYAKGAAATKTAYAGKPVQGATRDIGMGLWNAISTEPAKGILGALKALGVEGDGFAPGVLVGAGLDAALAASGNPRDGFSPEGGIQALSEQQAEGQGQTATSEIATMGGGMVGGISQIAVNAPVGISLIALSALGNAQQTYDQQRAMGKSDAAARAWAIDRFAIETLPMVIATRFGMGAQAKAILSKLPKAQITAYGQAAMKQVARELAVWGTTGAVQAGGEAIRLQASGENPEADPFGEAAKGFVSGAIGATPFAAHHAVKIASAGRPPATPGQPAVPTAEPPPLPPTTAVPPATVPPATAVPPATTPPATRPTPAPFPLEPPAAPGEVPTIPPATAVPPVPPSTDIPPVPLSDRPAPTPAPARATSAASPAAAPAANPPQQQTLLANPDGTPHTTVELPVKSVKLSKEVPNFKGEANPETGEVQPLKASKYERLGTAPIVVWQRTNGDMEVITGRHRLALARRLGEETIPAQVVREVDGYNKNWAARFDAEANIRDGQGSVADYANYFRHTEISEQEASGRGLLSRQQGRDGFRIGKHASDDLYALFRDGKISQAKAAAIAGTVPDNPGAQQVGMRYAANHTAEDTAEYIRSMLSAKPQDKQLDLFGHDEAWQVRADKRAKAAAKIAHDLNDERAALRAARSLSPDARQKAVAKYGFTVGSAEEVNARLEQLDQELSRWENWHLNPELTARVAAAAGEKPPDPIEQHAREALGLDGGTPATPIRFSPSAAPRSDSTPSPSTTALRSRISTLFPSQSHLVEVVDTGADLPATVRTQARARFGEGGHNMVEAVWHDGRVYINAALVSPERVPALIFHEVGIHEGLSRALGPERFGALMDEIATQMPAAEKSRIAIQYNLDVNKPGWQREAGEEWLARLAEDAKIGGRMQALFDRVVTSVNAFARLLGVQKRYTQAEVRTMLRQGLTAAAHARGEPTPYSDTPTDRARFSVVSRAWNDLDKQRRRLAAEWRTTPAKAAMSAYRDEADNASKIYGRVVSNDVLGAMRRAIGTTFNGSSGSTARIALTAMRESGQDRTTLEAFVPQLEAILRNPAIEGVHKSARKYLSGVTYALDHFDIMQGAANEYKRATMTQLNNENASGLPTAQRANYVYHAQEREPFSSLDDGGSGITGNFLRQRTAGDTFVDSMANGVKPVTLDAIDLLQGRVERGQRLINMRTWTQAYLPAIMEPTTGKPIMTDMLPPDPTIPGRDRPTAPPGYLRVEVGAGQSMAIHEGYAGIFKALTGQSLFNESLGGRALMNLVGGVKHIVLIGDTFHLGRVAYNTIGLTGTPAYKRGLLLMDYSTTELSRMAAAGEIDPAILSGLLHDKADLGLLIHHGLNVGNIHDAFNKDFVRKYSPLGWFNTWLFEAYQRGAMARSALIEYRLQQRMDPATPAPELARKTAFAINTKFGNLGRQGWITNKSLQDLARICLLAPGWNEGLLRSQLQSIRDLGKLPVDVATKKRIIIGAQLRVTGTLLAAGFIANQIINQLTRGKFTWENEEEGFDAKISAWIPDVIGDGPGMFFSPAAIPAEIAHQVGERWEKTGRLDKAFGDVLRYKTSPLARVARTWALREDQWGKATKSGWDTLKTSVMEGAPLPIGASAITRAGNQLITGNKSELFPGQFQKQALASFGMKTTGAPDPHQRISALAAEFKDEAGLPQAAVANLISPYRPFLNAIKMGNMKEAADQLAILRDGNIPEMQLRHYVANVYPHGTVMANKVQEAAFVASLTPEQKDQYNKARERRWDTAKKAVDYLIQHPPEGPDTPSANIRVFQHSLDIQAKRAAGSK